MISEIAQKARERVREKKKALPMRELIELLAVKQEDKELQARDSGNAKVQQRFPFEDALGGTRISFICEIKKASPSQGIIVEEFPYMQIAKEYEMAGAAAISVLTEPYYFQGDDQYLHEIANQVTVPVLRKDFVVDPYMIYEAKRLGASAVLLICAILEEDTLRESITIAHDLGLSALVETHTELEVEQAVQAGARIIGVNNRDLKTLEVDLHTTSRLRPLVPKDRLFVSESGIQTAQDMAQLSRLGVDGVLIGERLMRSPDKGKILQELMELV